MQGSEQCQGLLLVRGIMVEDSPCGLEPESGWPQETSASSWTMGALGELDCETTMENAGYKANHARNVDSYTVK